MSKQTKPSPREFIILSSVGIGGLVFFYQLAFEAGAENLKALAAVLTVVIAVTSVCFGAARATDGDAVYWYRRAGRNMFQAGLILLAALMFQFISVNSGWQWESDIGLFVKLSALHLAFGMIFSLIGISHLCKALEL